MSDVLGACYLILIGAILGLTVGAVAGISATTNRINSEAIERGYKVYDTKTGELKWKESDDVTQKE